MGCDTLVALAPVTRGGATLFAKNSDRPPRECQYLVRVPRRRHAPGARVRCQYVDLPEVEETAAVLGSQPWWLWGFEHGVNEHRVAIGNETVFAREPLGSTGLLGMDLVRLGLERARTASEALDVMTGLLAAHGQGGSGQRHLEFPYHNGFLVADPGEAWVLETSDRHWAARRVRDAGNVSNGLALGTDWERGSADLTAFAVAQGWWPADRGPVDFAAAYADDTGVPPNLCDARRRRAADLLEASRGVLTPAVLRGILRDHYRSGSLHTPRSFDDPEFFSLCMHADPLDNTTASMIATLPRDPDAPPVAWVCLGSPCVGAFVPCYVDVPVPAPLAAGAGEPDGSGWWRMRTLLTHVERDFARLAPPVRARWDAFEVRVEREAAAVEAEATAARREGRAAAASAVLAEFAARSAAAWSATLDQLIAETEAR